MKILVIQQKMIGDVLTSSILFEALRKIFPDAELHYMIYPHTKAVIENNPNIDQVIFYDPAKQGKFSNFLSFLKKIRQQEYDAVIDVYSKIGSALISRASGAKIRSGYKKWYTEFLYTHTSKPKRKASSIAGLAVENRLRLLKPIVSDLPEEIKPKIYLSENEIAEARKKLEAEGVDFEKPLVMIGILGSSPAKTYPLSYMAKLLDTIVENSEGQLLFNYIPKQKEEVLKLFELCNSKTKKRILLDLYGSSLREFLALSSHCDALIGNEGGAVNMAKALNIPTFSIFSPQIKKENWSIYEDGESQVSVHLSDFKPEMFRGLSKKELRKNSAQFYEVLTPNLIFAPLKKFIDNNLE